MQIPHFDCQQLCRERSKRECSVSVWNDFCKLCVQAQLLFSLHQPRWASCLGWFWKITVFFPLWWLNSFFEFARSTWFWGQDASIIGEVRRCDDMFFLKCLAYHSSLARNCKTGTTLRFSSAPLGLLRVKRTRTDAPLTLVNLHFALLNG